MSHDITGFVIEGDPEITEHLLHPLIDRWLDSIGSAATTTYYTAPSLTAALPSSTPSALFAPPDGRCICMGNPHQVASDNGRLRFFPTPETGALSRLELGSGDDVLPYIQTIGSAVAVSGHPCQVKAPRVAGTQHLAMRPAAGYRRGVLLSERPPRRSIVSRLCQTA